MSDREPLVSIVLPTYNRARLLGGALRSCLEQSWRNLELIVVDDGSADETPEVIAGWRRRDPRLRAVRQENGKIPRALNAGFRLARGEFFTWTSDDNRYEASAIRSMASYLLEHPEVGLVYCDCQVTDAAGNFLRVARRPPPEALERLNPVGSCFMYRRSVAERVGEYDPEAFLAEDYDYWLRISKQARVAHLAGAAPYRYRQHGEALTTLRGPEAELQAARVRCKHARGEGERRRLLAAGHRAAGDECRRMAEHRAALRHYLKALGLHPFTPGVARGLLAGALRRRPRLG